MSKKDEALRLALENICAAKLCEFNSMSSRHEKIRLMDAAITAIREALAEQPAQQPAQQPVSVTDELVNAYCEAWKQSFLADNAYHTVSVSPQDRKHIEAGLKAALAEQPAQQEWPKPKFVRNFDGVPCITLVEHEHLMRSRSQPAQTATYTCGVCGVSMQMEQPAQRCKYGNEPVSCTSSPMDCQCAIDAVFEQQAPIAYAVYHRMGGSKTLHWPEQHSDDGDHNEYQLVPLYTSPQTSKPFVGLTDEEREQIRQRWATQNWMLYDIINAVDAKLKEKNA